MIDKGSDKNYSNLIEGHFDNQAQKGNINDFIPYCIDDYLRAPFEYILKSYCKKLDGKKILDYCCGTGINSVLFSKKGGIIIGIDISKNSIEKASEKFKKLSLMNYKFYQMNAHYLKFDDNYFDYIICYKSLLYLNLENSFKELNRVLKENGKVIILENIGDNPIFNYYRYFKHILKSKKYALELNKIKSKDLYVAHKFFETEEKKFFDFFTIFGKFLKDKFKIKISISILKSLDYFILNRTIFSFLSFTIVKVLKKNKSISL